MSIYNIKFRVNPNATNKMRIYLPEFFSNNRVSLIHDKKSDTLMIFIDKDGKKVYGNTEKGEKTHCFGSLKDFEYKNLLDGKQKLDLQGELSKEDKTLTIKGVNSLFTSKEHKPSGTVKQQSNFTNDNAKKAKNYLNKFVNAFPGEVVLSIQDNQLVVERITKEVI